ncbi:MAG: S-layer family protein, partial [Desulfatibacillum sp.]|nr:S-layer family protein [Desulfatibacillum sp.]
ASHIKAASQTGSVLINAASVVVGSGAITGSVTATGSVNASVTITTTGAGGIKVGTLGTVQAEATGVGAVQSKVILNATTNATADVVINGKVQAGSNLGAAYVEIDAVDDVTVGPTGVGILADAAGAAIGSINIDAGGDVSLNEDVYANGGSAKVFVYADGATGITIGTGVDTGVRAIGATVSRVELDTTGGAPGGAVTVLDNVLAGSGAGSAKVIVKSDAGVSVNQGGSLVASGAVLGSVNITAVGDVGIGNLSAGAINALATTSGIVDISGDNIKVGGAGAASGSILGSAAAATVTLTSIGTTGIEIGVGDSVQATAGANDAVVSLLATDATKAADVIISGTLQATSTGNAAQVNVGTTANPVADAITINSGATVNASGADAGGSTEVNLIANGNITTSAAVTVSDTSTDATLNIQSSGNIAINAALTATGARSAEIGIVGQGPTTTNRVTVAGAGVTATGNSGNATVDISTVGTGKGLLAADTDALKIAAPVSALATDGNASVIFTSAGDATVQGAVVSTADDSVAGANARNASITVTTAGGFESTAGGTLAASATQSGAGSNTGAATVTIESNGTAWADRVIVAGAVSATAAIGDSKIDISSFGNGYGGVAASAVYITGNLTTNSQAGAGGTSQILVNSQGAGGSVIIGNTSALSATSAAGKGSIDLTSNAGTFQIDGTLTGNFALTGAVTVDTQGGGATVDIDLNNAISLTAGGGASSSVQLLAGHDVNMNATAADITVTGAAPVTITAATAGVNGG